MEANANNYRIVGISKSYKDILYANTIYCAAVGLQVGPTVSVLLEVIIIKISI